MVVVVHMTHPDQLVDLVEEDRELLAPGLAVLVQQIRVTLEETATTTVATTNSVLVAAVGPALLVALARVVSAATEGLASPHSLLG